MSKEFKVHSSLPKNAEIKTTDDRVIDPPEPKISGLAIILVIICLIGFFPLGIIMGLYFVIKSNREKKEWKEERIISRLDRT